MRATVFSGIFLLLSATALPQTQTQTRVPSGRAVLEAYVSAWKTKTSQPSTRYWPLMPFTKISLWASMPGELHKSKASCRK